MSDNLTIFGNVYEGVNTLTFTDTNDQQKVYINTADADATATDILSGKTAYINNTKVTGIIAFKPAQTYTPGTINQTISAGYFLSGDQTIAGDANLVAENIAQGVSIFGVTGTHSGGGGGGADEFIENHETMTEYTGNVSTIGKGAFAFCASLTTVSFPNCTSIGNNAFASCYSLTTVSFPNCTTIGDSAFYYCSSLSAASFPNCTSIGINAFCYCSRLTTINSPNCTKIGGYAFANCSSLSAASFPSCTSIGNNAFANCSSLSAANFPSCTSISGSAFLSCIRLTTVSFPNCTTIETSAFYFCARLTTVSFPNCTKIGSNAFYYCSSLTTVSFPSCTSIGNNAFLKCYNLISLYLTGSSYVSLSHSNAFSSTPIGGYSTSAKQYGSIYVPSSMLASYKTMTNWTYFSSRFVGV